MHGRVCGVGSRRGLAGDTEAARADPDELAGWYN